MKQEQHLHNKTKDEWGGDIGNAMVGGAITGLTTSLGVKGSNYLGNYLGSTVSNSTLSATLNGVGNGFTMSMTTSVGNSMSLTALNGGSFSNILKSGTDILTDKDIIKNSLTNGLTSGITVGLTDKLSLNNPTSFTDRLKQNTISNITSNTIQSVMNNDYDDFIDNLKHQSINTLVMTTASYAANWIGEQYHNNNFSNNDILNKLTQLTLHATLGAITSELMGNDGVSGAVSGVIGEIAGSSLNNNGVNKKVGSEIAGLSSGIVSLFVGKLRGLEDKEIINNIYNGYRIGKNASENNAYIGQRPLDVKGANTLYNLLSNTSFMDKYNIELEHEQIFFGDEEGGNMGFFEDSKVKPDEEKNLSRYKKSDDPQDNRYYDDAIMREAVKNVETKEYKLMGLPGVKYNCQNFVEDVRKEYNRLENLKNNK